MVRLTVLLLFFLICSCNSKEKRIKVTDLDKEQLNYKNLQLERIKVYENGKNDFYFTSLTMMKDGNLVSFDKNRGLVLKFNQQGEITEKTGGIGRGPNEYITDNNVLITSCGKEEVFVYDWSLARIHIYNDDFNDYRLIQLDGVPYEVSCIGNYAIAILYSTKPDVEVIDTGGKKINTFKLDNEPVNQLSMFKHLRYVNGLYFIGYYFQPKMLIYGNGQGVMRVVNLPSQDEELVKTAIRNISVTEKEVHIYFYDINSQEPEGQRKNGHVFTTSGDYKFSYQIPSEINYLNILPENRLITLEDSMKKIVLYEYNIE